MFTQLTLIGIVLSLLYRCLTPQRSPNFPPGPKNYPVVGGSYAIAKTDQKNFSNAAVKLGEQYGSVTGIYLGKTKCVLINGYETVKEVLTRDDFQGRPEIFIQQFANAKGQKLGLAFADGELWKDQRRFTLRHLRDFGFGKASMETIVHEEVEQCIQTIKKLSKQSEDSVIQIDEIFGPSIINILWAIMAGKRFDHDDPKFLHVLHLLYRSFRNGIPGGLLIDYPFLRFIPPFSKKWNDFQESRNAVLSLLRVEVEEHVATRDSSFSRDFIDLYLKEIEDSKENPGGFFFMDQLLALCSDLFGAGAETTASTVAFGILYMILYPEIQEKVQNELDRVVGKDRLPSYYTDKANMPYTEAVMTELVRVAGVTAKTAPHRPVVDTKLNGYDIPKDALVFVMLSSVHNEKSYWGDPELFRPERFLDAQGKYVKNDRIIGFGMGKRQCLGETLARLTYFDFFTAILQTFKFELTPGKPKPSKIPIEGFTQSPQPFTAKVIPRN